MKTDSLFYRLFQMRPQLLFDLLSDSPQATSDYQFTSVEVKQLSFRIDGIFLPHPNYPALPFYVVEVQFQPDEELYYRIFAELFLYLRQYQPSHPWRVVVIYSRRTIERKIEVHFETVLHLNQVTRIYLDELEESENAPLGISLVKLIIAQDREAPEKARNLLIRTKEEVEDSQLEQDIIDLIESIVVYKFPQMSC
jgi:predicted transposase/invertase (TIGR01784 family)